jgi:FtsZ-binding cell division protein ZapB
MEEDSFELLEDKVRRATELVKRLRRENKALAEDLASVRSRAQEAQTRETALEKGAGSSPRQLREMETLAEQLKVLRREREEVRKRISRLVGMLDSLD